MNARQLIENEDPKDEILGTLPVVEPGMFDNFEVHGMVFLGPIGDYDNAEPADDDTNADFWSVVGHYAPEMAHRDRGLQGLEHLADYDSEAVANAAADELTARYAHKRFGGMTESDDVKDDLIANKPPFQFQRSDVVRRPRGHWPDMLGTITGATGHIHGLKDDIMWHVIWGRHRSLDGPVRASDLELVTRYEE